MRHMRKKVRKMTHRCQERALLYRSSSLGTGHVITLPAVAFAKSTIYHTHQQLQKAESPFFNSLHDQLYLQCGNRFCKQQGLYISATCGTQGGGAFFFSPNMAILMVQKCSSIRTRFAQPILFR